MTSDLGLPTIIIGGNIIELVSHDNNSTTFQVTLPPAQARANYLAQAHRHPNKECDAPVATGVMPTGVWR